MQIVTNNPDFLNQLSADMNWLIKTPSMVKTNEWFMDTNPAPDLASKLASNTQLVQTIFEGCRPTVGDYFERLVLLWLHFQNEYVDIQQHIRVYDGKRTVGEMDFLLSTKTIQQTLHLEVAIKFYLLTKKDNKLQFIGPNSKDTFLKKYNKMCQHQLRLPQSPYAAPLIEKYAKPIVSKGLLKGYLFYPSINDWKSPPLIHHDIALNHQIGWWTSINHLEIPCTTENSRWIVFKKPFWLSIAWVSNTQKFTMSEIKAYLETHFSNRHYPVFLAEVLQTDTGWVEQSRGFVVNDTWPD